VGIVILVTGETIPLQLYLEDRFDVAGIAFGLQMRADQCVFCVLFVIEVNLCPAAARVAGFAGFAEVAFVIVVLEVAGNTCHIEFIGERILAVAAVTFLFGMLAVQHEIRVAVVIETGVVPAFRAVTGATFVAATAVMSIVLGMAVVAFRRRILERVVLMAVQARRFLVLADQRKIGGVVIEFHVEPLHRGVAVSAGRAQRVGVRVVFFMARITIVGRITMLFIVGVARGTFVFGVLAEQRKVREVVIEGRFVQTYDVCIATLVVRMTMRATGVPGVLEPAMKA